MKTKQAIQFRRRRKRYERKAISEQLLDSSSIGDLALLLLIFFIVTSSFILRQGLFLSLPPKNAAAKKVEPDSIVKIKPNNFDYSIDGVPYSRAELKAELIDRRQNKDDLVALIVMAEDVKYDRLVDSLSVVREARVKKVSIKKPG